MIKIYNAQNLNREEVIELWVKSFGDAKGYVEFFLDNCPNYICIEYFIDKKLVAQLFLLEGKLHSEKCMYLYAACTHEYYRCRGIMEELINFTKKHCSVEGYSAIFLVPANEKLYSYYLKLGFISSFFKKELVVSGADNSLKKIVKTDIEKALEIKKVLIENVDSFTFSDDVMRYTIKEHLFNGGNIYINPDDIEKEIAFYYCEGSNIVIKEYLNKNKAVDAGFIKYFSDKNVENIYISAPLVYNSKNIMEKYTKCGMCFPLNERLSDFLKNHTDLYAGMYLD